MGSHKVRILLEGTQPNSDVFSTIVFQHNTQLVYSHSFFFLKQSQARSPPLECRGTFIGHLGCSGEHKHQPPVIFSLFIMY